MSLFDDIHSTPIMESVSDKKETILNKIESECEKKGYTIKIGKKDREVFLNGSGSVGGGPGGPNSICIAGMGKENLDNVYKLIKDLIKDEKDFKVTQDSYFTIFLDYTAGQVMEEKVNLVKTAAVIGAGYVGINAAIKMRHKEEFAKMEKIKEHFSLMSYFVPYKELKKNLRNPISDVVAEYSYAGEVIFKYNTRYNRIVWIDSIYNKFKDYYELEVSLHTLGDKLGNDIWMKINDLYEKIYGDEPVNESVNYPTYRSTGPFENWLMAGTRHPGNVKKHDVNIEIFNQNGTVKIVNNTSLEVFEPVTGSSDYDTCMKTLKKVIHKDFKEYEYAFVFGKSVNPEVKSMIPALKDCVLAEAVYAKIRPTKDAEKYYQQFEMLIGNVSAIRNKVCKILKESGLGIEMFAADKSIVLYALKFEGYTRESSNEEDSDVMNESLETLITKPLLPSKVRLYHGSEKELTEIKPISWNMGTRLSKVRASSYWFMNKTYAWQHAVQRMIYMSKEYKNGEFDELSPMDGIPVVNDYETNHLLVSYIPGNKASEKLIKKIYSTPVYVYSIDINKKYVGRGQVGINNEYTLDIPVRPDTKFIVDPKDPETKKMYDQFVHKTPPQKVDIVKLFDQKHQGRNLYNKIADRLVYHPLDNVYNKRHEFMTTYKNPSNVPKYAKIESTEESVSPKYPSVKSSENDGFDQIPAIKAIKCFKGSNGCYNTIVRVDTYDKPLRAKSEVCVFKNDKIFLRMKDDFYKLPGGTWDRDESPVNAAIRETREEARIEIKDPEYVTTRIELFGDRVPKNLADIPEKYKWFGYLCNVYLATYNGPYNGHIDKVDEDRDLTYNGKFYPIKEIYNKLYPEHKRAVDQYLTSYKMESVITEAAGDTYVMKNEVYPIVEKTLSDPVKDKKFRNAVRSFIDRNSENLHTSGPVNMVPFTDADKQVFFEIFDIDKNDLIHSIDKMTKGINDKANWKLLKQNPVFCLFYECIRYYTLKKDEKGVNTALAIYALSVYPSVFAMLFQFGTNADVMKFTMDNLSAKYLMKQTGNVFGGLMKSIQNSYKFLKNEFIDSPDREVVRFITRIRNDQKSLFKNIANNYYKNHARGLRASTQSDTYGDNQLIDDNTNNTTIVEDTTRKIVLSLVTNGVDLTRATAAAKIANISLVELRFYLTKIITEDRSDELRQFVESIIFAFLYQEHHEPYEINEKKFLQFTIEFFRKTNTNDKNVNTLKTLLDKWSSDTGLNEKYRRLASQIAYKRGIYLYIILCIQYYNQ